MAVLVTLAVTAGLGGCRDDGDGEATPTSTVITAAPTTTTATVPVASTVSTGSADPKAPWQTGTVPRADVDEVVLGAWDKATNRDTCGLLVPFDLGPGLDRPKVSSTPITDNAGWEVVFRQGASVLQIQGLFSKESRTVRNEREVFSRRWADGSVARYGPDAANEEDPNPDPETSANEATLLLPGQDCAYVLYDTRGKTELEFILEHLRFVEGTE